MTSDDAERFAAAWSAAAEQTRHQCSAAGIRMAFDLLRGHSIEKVLDGILAHLRDPARGAFMPSPADVIRKIDGDQGERAWNDLRYAMQRFGPYVSVQFEDEAIAPAVRDLGGWGRICDSWDLIDLRRRFLAVYEPGRTGHPIVNGGLQVQDSIPLVRKGSKPVEVSGREITHQHSQKTAPAVAQKAKEALL